MFVYTVSAGGGTEIFDIPIFKNIVDLTEIKLRSKEFGSFKECVDCAKLFIDDVAKQLNDKHPSEHYYAQQSFNPSIDEDNSDLEATGSLAGWSENEIIRFYLINDAHKGHDNDFLTKLVIVIYSKHNKNKGS